ncbi:hypothetical protein [Paenibacillus lutimineralis]|uniref:TATA-box binding protein n=1 Tax=Paenibacillus lutimineralis TaxID=2707005 RepID=A0A3Q9IBM8_9BACL|nr:hypothetical protein [Paenibacillus lutimineralis]AZS17209.1 hypothetical protein EI981_24045 [Paenibacillus lutimineralis]
MPGRERVGLNTLKRCGFVMIGFALIMVIIGFTGLDEGKVNKVAAVDKQWKSVLALAESSSEGKLRATVKWQGKWNSLLEPSEAAYVLAARLGLSTPEENEVQGHAVYNAQGFNVGVYSKLSVMPEEGGTSFYVILLMEGDARANGDVFSELQTVYGHSLQDEGVDVNWNAALQGFVSSGLSKELEVETQSPEYSGASIQKLLNKIEQQTGSTFKLHSAEEYVDEDSQTISRSYEAGGLPISVRSGDYNVALQMAVHYNVDTGEKEISFGSPLLTVEY